ncbi:MAG: SDR family oxidoreductase [Bauldia sp.]
MGSMQGRRGLVMGVANDHSIAWGIARRLAAEGAELAISYHPNMETRVRPLAESIGCQFLLPCDVAEATDSGGNASLDAMFSDLGARWGSIDFLVHAIAFSDTSELRGRYADTTRANFVNTMVISCFSFTEAARRAAALMPNGGAMVTLTYLGATQVIPSYNVMGVAKAALEASVRYLAADFGGQNVRVNAISAGPVNTMAARGIGNARALYSFQKTGAPLKRTVTLDEIGGSALYLLSDLSSAVTGQVHFVDTGFNIVAVPQAAIEGPGPGSTAQ